LLATSSWPKSVLIVMVVFSFLGKKIGDV